MKKIIDFWSERHDDGSLSIRVKVEEDGSVNGRIYGIRISEVTQNTHWYVLGLRALANKLEQINGTLVENPDISMIEIGNMDLNGLMI